MFLATLLTAAAVAAPSTQPATNVTATGATLNGTVDAPAEAYFQYGTTTAYGLTTAEQPVAAGPVAVPVTGLTAQTTYHFRLVVDGVPANDRTFTTVANPRPPGITSQYARQIGPQSATTTAQVNGNGSATTYRIEYGTSTRYGRATATADAGPGQTSVTAALTGLRPYTRYHWRTVATNSAGTTVGRDRTFRTARLPESVTIALARSTVGWGTDVTLGGRVTGAGAGGMTVALQQQRFPVDQDFSDVATSRTSRDGSYLFTIGPQWSTTRYRVLTRTQVVVGSPVVTARSAVRVGVGARHPRRTRARVQGWVLPAVNGTATLQRYRPGRGWRRSRRATIAPADALRSRFGFGVWRPRRGRPAASFRVVVVPVRGAHVRGKSRMVRIKPRPRRR